MKNKISSLLCLCLLLNIFSASLHASLPQLPASLETLTIQEGGRRKPYFVFTEETLRSLSGKTTLLLDGKKILAPELITSFWMEPDKNWTEEPLILVSNQPLKKELGLNPQQKLFSYQELNHQEKLLNLIKEAAIERRRDPKKRLQGLAKEASDIGMRMSLFEELKKGSLFAVIPNPESAGARWASMIDWKMAGGADELTAAFEKMQSAWFQSNPAAFSEAVDQFVHDLVAMPQPDAVPAWKLKLEVLYQQMHPFRWAWIFYAIAGILLFLFSGLKKGEAVRSRWNQFGYRAASFFAGSGFLLQAAGLLARVLIAGRPPVTNMYESVIWVAFGTILFALVFETIYHVGTFLLAAVPVAVASLILADSQPMILDQSIHPLTPVLRDNFWLTIHVLTITLSYAAFALSLGVAHVALLRKIFHKKVTASLYNYLYRCLQVGVLMLATGVILGGVWANYSWGRFWDWDPKETWALVALLGYLFLLHGRIAGRWGGFGLAVGSVIAFMSVLMAWYGVNFVLGAGLHSYGFGTGGLPFVVGFVLLETAVIIAALMVHQKKLKHF